MRKRIFLAFVFFLMLTALAIWKEDIAHLYAFSNKPIVPSTVQVPTTNPPVYTPTSASGIMLTFDDKAIDSWYSFIVLNNKYGAKATFYVNHFPTLTLDELVKLKLIREANNEIGFHSLNHINALNYIKQNSIQDYIDTEILPGLAMMEENGFRVTSFAYPYGVGNKALDQALSPYFASIRYTDYPSRDRQIEEMDRVFIKSKKQKTIYAVGIDNGYEHDLPEIYQAMDRAYKNNEVLVLYGHVISDKKDKESTSIGKLEHIVRYACEKGMTFYTASELGS